ncbi:MAG: hypothetical protein JNJ77_00010 [Planctomycetia bacterium]|nr:hypothetical protein [Planctomycetia bacterium]
MKLKKYEQAETWQRKYLAAIKQEHGPNSIPYGQQLYVLTLVLLAQNRWHEAETVILELKNLTEKTDTDSWSYFNIHSLLGAAMMGQKRYAEAEPLLIKGYEGLKQREKTIPPRSSTRLPEALDRLIQLYTETNKPDEVKKWQAERDRISKTPEKN